MHVTFSACSAAGRVDAKQSCMRTSRWARKDAGVADLASAAGQRSQHQADSHQHQISGCSNKNAQCTGWGSSGDCVKNPRYMTENCRQTCGLCAHHHLMHVPNRVLLWGMTQ